MLLWQGGGKGTTEKDPGERSRDTCRVLPGCSLLRALPPAGALPVTIAGPSRSLQPHPLPAQPPDPSPRGLREQPRQVRAGFGTLGRGVTGTVDSLPEPVCGHSWKRGKCQQRGSRELSSALPSLPAAGRRSPCWLPAALGHWRGSCHADGTRHARGSALLQGISAGKRTNPWEAQPLPAASPSQQQLRPSLGEEARGWNVPSTGTAAQPAASCRRHR